ncbi:unnamed protein product [Closterium sp. NIES-64]|nr:unnamed protein product [Closterium sp. NIES-64]
MSRECNLIADQPGEENNATRTGPVRSTTVHTILGRIKACQMAARVEATLYREKELGIMREISVVRSEELRRPSTRHHRRYYTAEQFHQIMMRVLLTWAAAAWNPRATTPSQTLWRFLLMKVLTLLSHHTLLRGASIREITLPDVFLYHLASTSEVNPDSQPVVMVIAARNSKTSKDARLQQSYAARHMEAELCAVGETGLWLHFILDQIGGDACRQRSDADAAVVHFLRTLVMFRRIVVEDLAVKLVRTPWHPYVQGSKLCRIALFQHWAKRVESVDTDTIKKRRDPTQIQPEEISVRMDTQYHNMSLKEALKKEVERSALEKLGFQETIEKQNDTIRVAHRQACSTHRGTPSKRDDGKPPPPPQTAEEASYKLNVVQPWRDSKTVRDAWRLWNSATANDNRRLCDRVAEPGFIDRHTLLKGVTQGALNMRVRRMLKAMDAVRQLRASDGDADTEAVVDALNTIAAPGIGTFCDALTVLNPETAPTMSKEPGMGVKGLGPKVVSKLRLACALVALELKPTTWVDRLFPDTWEEQMPKTVADLAKQTAPAQRPPSKHKKSA